MNEELMIRMVEALEGIQSELIDLNQNLEKCIINTSDDRGSICIVGGMYQY